MKLKHSIQIITTLSLLIAAVVVTQAFSQSTATTQSVPTVGAERTLTGVISDTMCGKTHMAKDKTAAECTRICVKRGRKYALVVGNKVYTLSGYEPEVDNLAGQQVTVKGTVNADTINVNSVTAAKRKTAA